MNYRLALILLAFAPAIAAAQTSQPAFPTAEGFGMYAQGGRGGNVIYVTNLNDSGPGSLREAVQAKGPRTVLFKVSGTIELKKQLRIDEPYITIAGQSAPGDGICLRNYELYIKTHDAIVRYIRVRPGDVSEGERDAISVISSRNVILDHISATWSIDEGLSTTHGENVTVQWCIIAEALHNSHHHKGNHGYGSILEGQGVTYHHDLYAHNRSRNPRPESGTFDFVNNVIYDWNGNAGYAEGNTHKFNYVNNFLRAGPSTVEGADKAYHTGGDKTYVYFTGNVLDGVGTDEKILDVRKGGHVLDKPVPTVPVKTESAEEAFKNVLANVGCTLPARDVADQRIVDTVKNKTGKQINSQDDVGGWPELKSAPPSTDTDNDGMPDEWETAHKLDPKNSSDGNARGEGGYTNLEIYLNSIGK